VRAKTRLSKLVALAEKGALITIARRGKPVAKLGPVLKAGRRRLPPDDPLLNLDKFGFSGSGGRLTNKEIDRTVYGA
jgi:antitoxin (DNA-binding transcriptional repressor) of toxin-antitoxin stability system